MLTNDQIEDLAQLEAFAERFGANMTIIGAAALLCFVDLGRFTRDIDIVVALDLEDFTVFSSGLKAQGLAQEQSTGHRWRGPSGSIIDLMPAGPKLRAAKRMVWPESQFEMSLIGFEHVFADSVQVRFAGVQFQVAPPPIIALLKIVAYAEDRNRRQKDLMDLRLLLDRYEAASDRIFSDEVFAADLQDIEYASAFLLGLDIGAFVTDTEAAIEKGFLNEQRVSEQVLRALDADDLQQREILRFQRQLRAFQKGFERNSKPRVI